jgi:hypothetical protein
VPVLKIILRSTVISGAITEQDLLATRLGTPSAFLVLKTVGHDNVPNVADVKSYLKNKTIGIIA